jgi:hypothetical protein
VLLVGVNAFAFFNHLRWDWTRDGEFTLPESVREQLANLEGDTRIVV